MTREMSRMSAVLLLIICPIITCRRLIVGPQVETAYDSVLVSSDPIKVTEGKRSENASVREPDHAIRLNSNKFDENRIGKDCKYSDISCLYGVETPKVDYDKPQNQDIIDRFLEQYSSITNAKFGTTDPPRGSDTEVKASYWDSPRPDRPFDDKKDWVSLDTVPWSTSTVSKWQSNAVSPVTVQQQQRPTDHHQLPSEDKPWQYGAASSFQSTTPSWTSAKPSPVTTNYGSYTPVSGHHSPPRPPHWGITNEIITDNSPSNFPVRNGAYQTFQSPQFESPPMNLNPTSHEGAHYPDVQVARPTRYPTVTGHPTTYPDSGNGEWVLLSTTKGYSLPTGYRGPGKTVYNPGAAEKSRQEPGLSRYHEEDIDDRPSEPGPTFRRRWDEGSHRTERRSEGSDDTLRGLRVLRTEEGSRIYAAAKGGDGFGGADWNMEDSPLQILYSSKDNNHVPSVTLRRSVRLQVLPPADNSTTLSHGGLLEVDARNHSVDEERKASVEDKIKELSKIAKVRRSNYTLYRVVPAPVDHVSGKSLRDKSTAVLAAVGAGMIPATMAVLVPMALGRRKRSLTPQRHSDNDFTGGPRRILSSDFD